MSAIPVLLTGPATAEELTAADGRADVAYYDATDGDPFPGVAVPDRRYGDLTRFRVRYGEHRIRVVMRFRDLRRSEPVLMIQARVRWHTRIQFEYGEAIITATEANRSGTARFTTNRRCVVAHQLHYDDNRATLSFPSRCIDTPRWVQFNAAVFTVDDIEDPTYFYADDVYPIFDPEDDGNVEHYTRRIHRG